MKARPAVIMAGLLAVLARSAVAGPWNVEPLIGASAEYDTNPALRRFDPASEDHVAAIFNLPLRYDGDAVAFAFTPNGRISNSRGYASLASSYVHLDSSLQYTGDRDSAMLQGEVARDSSVVHAGEFVSGLGVRRDSDNVLGEWTHSMSERAQLQMDASWNRVTYQQPPGASSLVDYRYASAGPTLAYSWSERDTLKLIGSAGRFDSLDGITASRSQNLQLGLVHQLDEIYTLSLDAGYSRSTNTEHVYFGPFLLGSFTAHQNGAVYSATLTRRGEQSTFTAGASRSLVPTGFAFLSEQDGINLGGGYVASERWEYAVNAGWQRTISPGIHAMLAANVRYATAQFTATWHATQQWRVALHVSRNVQEFGPPTVSAASTGVSLDIVRQFLRAEL